MEVEPLVCVRLRVELRVELRVGLCVGLLIFVGASGRIKLLWTFFWRAPSRARTRFRRAPRFT